MIITPCNSYCRENSEEGDIAEHLESTFGGGRKLGERMEKMGRGILYTSDPHSARPDIP
jgi:hypothetical protein